MQSSRPGNIWPQRRLAEFWLGLGMVALLAALGGCAAPQEISVQRETSQTFAPVSLVEVLHALPSSGYVRIATLDVQAPAGTPIAQLLAQLQAKAGALGANAIVVQDLSVRESGALQYSPSGGQFTQSPGELVPRLRATAIKIQSGEKP